MGSLSEKLILGTVQFGLPYGINNSNGKPEFNEVQKILNTCIHHKIYSLDTAEGYGDSQDVIGKFQVNSNFKFNIITKFSEKEYTLYESNFDQLIKSDIKRLNCETLYGYMFHNIDDYRKHKSEIPQLLSLKEKGLISKIGVSVYTNEEAIEVSRDKNIELVQLPFNLLDNESKRGDALKALKEVNIETHVRSVFLQGLFFKETKSVGEKLGPIVTYLEKIKEIAVKEKVGVQDLALQYALSKKYIDKVLVGVDNELQLLINISSLNSNVSENSFVEIDKINVKEIELLSPVNW